MAFKNIKLQPYNPWLRELIADKKRFSSPSCPENEKVGFRGWNERGYLPHRDAPGLTQLVTFRLFDSLPRSLRSEWAHEIGFQKQSEQRRRMEAYLDRGIGSCCLRNPEIAQAVEKTLLFFHLSRYDLQAWCIMPNHVHVLFEVSSTPMANIVRGWKTHTASLANKLLKKTGPFWAADYWDTFMRNEEQRRKAIRYIENNPTKAALVLDPRAWRWSSARYRDDYNALVLPS